MAKKVKLIRGMLTSVSSQRTQYKPYHYTLDFAMPSQVGPVIYVEVEVPTDLVVDEGIIDGNEFVVLSLDGLNAILQITADSIDKLDEEYQNRFYPK